ncbi:MAG: 23S rRNA (pseudouridine(1915)-N(3))-methyltransferase RlmH [bacterium]
MKIVLISIGKENDSGLSETINEYVKRLERYSEIGEVEWKILPTVPSGDRQTIKKKEGEAVEKVLKEGDFLIALDENGKELSTPELSEFLSKRINSGVKRLVFIIGGPFGISEELLEKANFKWSLSRLTFPHRLVRLTLAETLYRSMSFLKGEPYHHV